MMTKEFIKLNNLIGWIVWAIATVTYCSTIEPTASFWDCGEYIACSYKLEVGHPPGAPFFLLIGRFFSLLGGDDPSRAGMMINVMSALCSSFTILFLFWTITRLGIKALGQKVADLSKSQQWAVLGAGMVGALAYTFSDSFWFSAVEGEVYAMSSFFTAIVFWAILKWDEEDSVSPTSALRWIVLIAYLVGLSIGVHLLNLLVIPAIGFIIYFKKYKFTWKGFFIAGISSVMILGLIQNLIIPKMVKFISDYEVFFTNKMHLGYSTGTIVFFLLLIVSLTGFIMYTVSKKEQHYKIGFYAGIILVLFAVITAPSNSGKFFRLVMLSGFLYAIHYFKSKTITLNTIFLSFATLLIGYSSFFVLVIRSQANPPMDENDPENAPNMLSYLLREQYGDWPILYGQYYNAPAVAKSEYGSGDPIYAKDEKNKNYKVIDSRQNSIPKYEKEFCTIFPRMWSQQSHHEAAYKYWGNVAEHHRNKVMENRHGETETVEIPTMMANLNYFFTYQLRFMYLRYFYWNFVGRQNDVQGMMKNTMEGNWVTGITAFDNFFYDSDTTKKIYRDKNNFAENHFYALPLILGLLGMFFHFKRNKPDAWVVLCFFLLTGLAIVIYLNQTPYQPRERDYAYAGSFYAFAIWIGFGVLFIYDKLSKKAATMGMAIGSTALSLIVPGIMAKEGWNDHDRSLRTLSRDVAINYLQSCAPNAILFTNGDNDTFPLWYAQEVEGIRTDVRVVNLSLLQTDWYINQMRRAAYDSKPVPFTIPEEKLQASKLEYLVINTQNQKPMDLRVALKEAISDDPTTKMDNGGELIDILPAKLLYVNVDSLKVMHNKVISVKDTARLAKRVSWDLGGRSYITKNDLMVLDLIANNDWKRPIYFAVTTGDEAYVGLKKYFQLEGLAYRFVPVKQSEMEEAQGGRVNTEVMYDNIMNKFLWGGMDKKGVNLDENCVRMVGNLRMQMGVLAGALIGEGKNKKAKAVLDKCLQVMPDENVSYDATVFTICAAYYQIGETQKANELAKKLFDIFEGDLKIYNEQKGNHRIAFNREMNQAKEIMRRLTGLTQQFKQAELSKQFMQRMQSIMPPEEINPSEQQMP
ncbi:MAG: formate-dependent nitrite reductase, rane component [Bacteroidetes bacterium]|nr:formate-dependent nitrite reductase, rane component [Bacteroidota bacterium]